MVVVDSSAFIHLLRTGKAGLLRTYFGKISVTPSVVDELTGLEKAGAGEIRKGLNVWIVVSSPGKDIPLVSGLERTDMEVVLLAKKKGDILLSNDFAQIQVAQATGVDCWWVTTLLLQAVKKKKLAKEEAKHLLYQLVQSGMRLSVEVYAAVEQEIDRLQ